MKSRFVLLACAASLVACNPAVQAPSAALPVYVQTVQASAQGAVQRLAATVQARQEVELAFRTAGRVQKRWVDVGQRVRAGQALAQLELSDYQLALQAAQAQLQATQLDAAQQQRDAVRLERLVGDGSVGAADAERQRTGAGGAAARVQAAQAQAQLAAQRLGYATLVAPFDGVVTQLRLEPGQVVGEGAGVLGLARLDALELQADVPEGWVSQLRSLEASALAQRWTLRELAPAAHPQTRTHRARFSPAQSLPWQDGLLGRSTVLSLQAPAPSGAVTLPSSALLGWAVLPQQPAQAQVWTVEGGKLKALPVQVLDRQTDAGRQSVQVAGLPAGAVVVMLGAHKLDAGMAVRPVPLERQP
jgi:RND family efflux transporter MFP subunit